MGVAGATQYLAERNELHAVDVDGAPAFLQSLSPDPARLAYIVDVGRFAHRMHTVISRNVEREQCTLVDFIHATLVDITTRCLVAPNSEQSLVIACIDNYCVPNPMKDMTTAERAHAVHADAPYIVEPSIPNPVMTREEFKGLYANTATRLAMYTRFQELANFGETCLGEQLHCVSLDTRGTQVAYKRAARHELTFPPLEIGASHVFDLRAQLAHFAVSTDIAVFQLPATLMVAAFHDENSSNVFLTCGLAADVEGVAVHRDTNQLQWIAFQQRIGNFTLVVNVTTVVVTGTIDDMVSTFQPVVVISLFAHVYELPLKSLPHEADFSSVEFTALLAMLNFAAVVRCAEDSDWTLFAPTLQKAIENRGLDTVVVSHVCPSQVARAPDRWVNTKLVIQDRALDFAALFYVVGHHDFSAGLRGVGAVGQLKALNAWAEERRGNPFKLDTHKPSQTKPNEKLCRVLAVAALKDGADVNECVFALDKRKLTFKQWLRFALHPMVSLFATLWPLDE